LMGRPTVKKLVQLSFFTFQKSCNVVNSNKENFSP
jgi:hypothetical protein